MAAAQSLDLVEQPAEGADAAAAGVLSRLRAREEQRAQEAAKRLEELQVSSDPRESVDAFMEDFSSQRQGLLARIESAVALPVGTAEEQAGAKAVLDQLAADVAELGKAVADAAYFLPQYDLRQCTLAVTALKEQQESAAAALQPRRRFAFSKKVAAPPSTAAAAATEPQGTPWASAAADASSGEAEATPGRSGSGGAAPAGTALRGLSGRTVVHCCSADGTEDCTLSDLENCTVFLLGPIAALFLHQLRRCRLYTGPVAGATFVEDALECTLMLASRQVRIHSAQRCDFYLRLRSHPIIEHSNSLRFAPYAFTYPGCGEDLAAQGLEHDNGRWAQVQDFGWLRATPSPHWCLLPEAERVGAPAVPEDSKAGACRA